MLQMQSIQYDLDCGISIFCKSSREKKEKVGSITPELLRYAIINYDISLIDNPIKRVREQYKVNKRNIEFQQDHFVLFLPVDNIIRPNESQIILRSIAFYLKDSKKELRIDQTYSFTELQKNANSKITHAPSKGKKSTKAGKGQQRAAISSKTSSMKKANSTLTKKENITLFIDSFQKFKQNIKETDLTDLFSTKEKALNFNLKNFGISLLCKLLLLIKYLNTLVDNEFQADLQTFLKTNLLKSEALT